MRTIAVALRMSVRSELNNQRFLSWYYHNWGCNRIKKLIRFSFFLTKKKYVCVVKKRIIIMDGNESTSFYTDNKLKTRKTIKHLKKHI